MQFKLKIPITMHWHRYSTMLNKGNCQDYGTCIEFGGCRYEHD